LNPYAILNRSAAFKYQYRYIQWQQSAHKQKEYYRGYAAFKGRKPCFAYYY
jgi:hypothetical protein